MKNQNTDDKRQIKTERGHRIGFWVNEEEWELISKAAKHEKRSAINYCYATIIPSAKETCKLIDEENK